MSGTQLENAICEFISEHLLGGMVIAPGDELLLTDLIDSLGVMRLVAHLEDTYDVKISPEDVVLETMQNVDAIAHFLRTKHKVST